MTSHHSCPPWGAGFTGAKKMRFAEIAAEAPRYGVEFRRVLGRDGSDHGWVVERGDGLRAVVYRLGPRLWSACCGSGLVLAVARAPVGRGLRSGRGCLRPGWPRGAAAGVSLRGLLA